MPKQILLVDDSVTIQRVVEITFAREDYHITSARSADDGIAKAKELRPDVVLADAGLPGGKTGYDVCAAVKADLPGVPVLILTGNFSPYDEVKGGKVGADGHVVKPFETQALIDKVADCVKRGGAKTMAQPMPAPQIPATPAAAKPAPAPAPPAPTPMPVPKPTIEPMGKPLSVVAQEASAEVEKKPPVIPQPAPPKPPAPGLGAKTMMGFPAVTPPTVAPPSPPPPAPAPPPVAVKPVPIPAPAPIPVTPAPVPAAAKPSPSMPQNVPQMPRPSMIPHVSAPTPMAAAPAPASPPKSAPRATLMGIPTVNPANLPPGAVPLPASPPKPAAWAPPPPAAPAPVAAHAPPPAAPPPAAHPAAPIVSAVVDHVQEKLAAKSPEHAALASLSREVIEQIAWEVVPELAEAIIREQLDRLVKERNS